jgi:hemerythrin
MPLLDVRHLPAVALSFMNDDHHLEACLLNDLAEAMTEHVAGRVAAADVLELLDTLLDHTREHFAREEIAMEEAGFPPYVIHKAEHDRALAELAAEGRDFAHGGDAKRFLAYVSRAVPAWLLHHIQTMDLVSSRFVASRVA